MFFFLLSDSESDTIGLHNPILVVLYFRQQSELHNSSRMTSGGHAVGLRYSPKPGSVNDVYSSAYDKA